MSNAPTSQTRPAIATLSIGDIVENFGAIVRVIADNDPERGTLVELIPAEKGGVLQGGVGDRYYANPEKCFPVKRETWGNVEILAANATTVFFHSLGHVYRADRQAVMQTNGIPFGRWECSLAHWNLFRKTYDWAPEVVA